MAELIPMMTDPSQRREMIKQKILEGLQESFPMKSRNKTIELADLKYQEQDYSSGAQKQAILRGESLNETVKGTVTVRDNEGKVIDRAKNFVLARVPYFTPRHTFILDGNEYSISNMIRRKPGVYARKRANGILEASFNTHGGKNFRISMDPAKGEPQLEYGATKIPLYPILRRTGMSHDRIAQSWGHKLTEANQKNLYRKADQYVDKLYKKVLPEYRRDSTHTPDDQIKEIVQDYTRAAMDPDVTQQTLGTPYRNVTPNSLLDASSKILRIFKETDEVDDQDNLDFKHMVSVDDLFKERIKLDARDIAKKLTIKMEATPEVKKVLPSGPFTKGLRTFINTSQLASIPTQTNPIELIDSAMRVTSLGEGGISTERAVPIEARQTHVTQIGALDPIRTPESFRAGIDIRAAMLAQRDAKGNIYVPIYDVKTNRRKNIRAGKLQTSVVAFPNQELRGTVDALVHGMNRRVPASKVDYQIPHASFMYSPTTNLIPFLESAQGNRAVMGSKMQVQALSLVDREAPYVQVKAPGNTSYEQLMGRIINPVAPVDGTIAKVDADYIYIRPDSTKVGAEGPKKDARYVKVPYDTNFPLAAKTYLHHNLNVKVGDKVKRHQLLANSNFSRNGTLALGKNMRLAFMPYYGANSNDAVVVSEGAAKKLTSERMYKVVVPRDSDLTFKKTKHQSYFGHGYTKNQYEPLDSEGVPKPGSKILPGDPVVLGLRKTQLSADDMILGKLHRSLVRPYSEFTKTWDHDHAGEVVDVVKTPKRIALTIKTQEPAGIGDKISGRYGNKGVISRIIPDDQMIQDAKGRPIDILMTSAGVVSRINPSQILETAAGKVVEKTGKPLLIENFRKQDNNAWAKSLLKKHGIKDKETVFDPVSGKKIPKVFVGNQYIMKLFKSTDTNYGARGVPSSYDLNQQPTKGGTHSAKVLGKMEFDALVGYGARNILRDAASIKSQKNDEYWRAIQLGYPTPPPRTSFAYNKFLNMLTGAGIKINRDKSLISLAPLTDEDVLEQSSGEVKDSKIVQAKNLKPEIGGLFDPAITGGLSGEKWSHISLAEPIISPIFKDPVRRLLNLTNAQLDKELKENGGAHIQRQLKRINVAQLEKDILSQMRQKKGLPLDTEVKKVKYLRALKSRGLTPDKAYIVSKIPVTPPVTRPVLPMTGSQQIIYGDANPLYQDLIYINNQLKDAKKNKLLIGEEEKLRPALQEAVGAVYGTNDPVTAKSRARGHKGFLTFLAGKGTGPKFGYFQSKLMKRTQDVAGRGTIVPDSTLGIDEVGLPEDMLWSMYDKFIIRRLVQTGYPALHAKQMVKDRHPGARDHLMREIQERPVLINRAPTLHRYNILASTPKPVPGRTIRVNPFVEKAQDADYDGDTMMVHVPVSAAAVEESKDLMLSNILFSDKSKGDLLVFPQHEAIMGINHAASLDDKNRPKVFKNKAAAMTAYNSGKIGLGTRIEIKGSTP